jgi:hypothetical protein
MASRYYQEYLPEGSSPELININKHTRGYFGSKPNYRSDALEELNQFSKEIQTKYRKKLTFRERLTRPVTEKENNDQQKQEIIESSPVPISEKKLVSEKEKFYGDKWDFDTSFLKNSFWHFVVLVALIPLIKSCVFNVIDLSSNINKNFRLSHQQGQLVKDKTDITGKIHEYHSKSGMKRTIKQEIKVIEKNEILIKLQ